MPSIVLHHQIICLPVAVVRGTSLFDEPISFFAGVYDIVLEWHSSLPGTPRSEHILMLEYEYKADPSAEPSPSPPSFPRMVAA